MCDMELGHGSENSDHDIAVWAASVDRREALTQLSTCAQEAQDVAGWADPTTREGQMQLAASVAQLGQVVVELVRLLRDEG